MTHEEEARRGKEAQRIIENPVYSESVTAIEAEIIRQWRDARNSADREQLHQLLGLLGKLQTALESTMRSGEVAASELARKKSIAERMGLKS